MRRLQEGWKRPYLAPLGRQVRELREARGWTMADLARRSGLTRSQVRKLETAVHSPGRPTLEKLAAALEVAVSNLVPDVTPPDVR